MNTKATKTSKRRGFAIGSAEAALVEDDRRCGIVFQQLLRLEEGEHVAPKRLFPGTCGVEMIKEVVDDVRRVASYLVAVLGGEVVWIPPTRKSQATETSSMIAITCP